VHLAYARWQEQQRQPALAREAYQKALDHDPKSVEALLGLARLDQLAGRNAEAEHHLTKAQQLQPQSALVNAAWGEFFAAQQNWPRAIERYRLAINLAPDEQLYKHQLAVALVKSGAINEGLAMFTPIVGQAEAHYNVGILLYQMGHPAEAEGYLRRAVALKPELTPANNMIAKIQRERSAAPAMVASAPNPAPMTAPAAPPQPQTIPTGPVTAASWTSAKTVPVESASFLPPTVSSPQQVEQWRNQQAAPQ